MSQRRSVGVSLEAWSRAVEGSLELLDHYREAIQPLMQLKVIVFLKYEKDELDHFTAFLKITMGLPTVMDRDRLLVSRHYRVFVYSALD